MTSNPDRHVTSTVTGYGERVTNSLFGNVSVGVVLSLGANALLWYNEIRAAYLRRKLQLARPITIPTYLPRYDNALVHYNGPLFANADHGAEEDLFLLTTTNELGGIDTSLVSGRNQDEAEDAVEEQSTAEYKAPVAIDTDKYLEQLTSAGRRRARGKKHKVGYEGGEGKNGRRSQPAAWDDEGSVGFKLGSGEAISARDERKGERVRDINDSSRNRRNGNERKGGDDEGVPRDDLYDNNDDVSSSDEDSEGNNSEAGGGRRGNDNDDNAIINRALRELRRASRDSVDRYARQGNDPSTTVDAVVEGGVNGFIRLRRLVEMYQWTETTKTKTIKHVGGSETTTTTYEYRQEWSSVYHDSSQFEQPSGHTNPSMHIQSKQFTASLIRLGPYEVTADAFSDIPDTPVPVTRILLPSGSGYIKLIHTPSTSTSFASSMTPSRTRPVSRQRTQGDSGIGDSGSSSSRVSSRGSNGGSTSINTSSLLSSSAPGGPTTSAINTGSNMSDISTTPSHQAHQSRRLHAAGDGSDDEHCDFKTPMRQRGHPDDGDEGDDESRDVVGLDINRLINNDSRCTVSNAVPSVGALNSSGPYLRRARPTTDWQYLLRGARESDPSSLGGMDGRNFVPEYLPHGYTPMVGDVRVRYVGLRGPISITVLARQSQPSAGLSAMVNQFQLLHAAALRMGLIQPPSPPPSLASSSSSSSSPSSSTSLAQPSEPVQPPAPVSRRPPSPPRIDPASLPSLWSDPDIGLPHQEGSVTARTLLRASVSTNENVLWLLRALGAAGAIGGIALILSPIPTVADVIPLAGRLLGVGTFGASLLIGGSAAFTTVTAAWIYARFRSTTVKRIVAVLYVLSMAAVLRSTIGFVLRTSRAAGRLGVKLGSAALTPLFSAIKR